MCKGGRSLFDYCRTEAWFKESTRSFLIPLCIVLELSDRLLTIAATMLIPQYLEMFYICSSYVHSGSQFRGLETAIQEISGLEEIQS